MADRDLIKSKARDFPLKHGSARLSLTVVAVFVAMNFCSRGTCAGDGLCLLNA
jgi:hypothetical protein